MAVIEVSGKAVEVDDEGYLVNTGDWTEEVACALADREGVSAACPLTKDRMDILKFLRAYYQEFEAFPIVSAVCKKVHQPKDCEYREFINPFMAWKLAGLPKPTTQVFASVPDHLIKT